MTQPSSGAPAQMQSFPKGTYLFKEGEETIEVYVLVEGGVEITVSGKPVTIIVDKGSFIGEMSVLLGQVRTATAVTIADSKFMVIEGNKIATLLQTMPNMGLKLLKDLAQRVQMTTRKLVTREQQITDLAEQPQDAVPSFDDYMQTVDFPELAELMAELYKENLFRRRTTSFEAAGRDYNRFKNDLDIMLESRFTKLEDILELATKAGIKGLLKDKMYKQYENDMKLLKKGS